MSGNSASAQVGGGAFTLSSSPLDLGYWNLSQWIQMESEAKTSSWGFLVHSDYRFQGHTVCWLIQVLLPCQGQVGEDEDEEEA